MTYFDTKIAFVKEVVERIENSPLRKGSHLYDKAGDEEILIKDAVSKARDAQKNTQPNPAICLLRVVLAANRNYNRAVKGKIEGISKKRPDLQSFDDLNDIIKVKSKEEFFKFWGHKDDKKYNTLRSILAAIEELRKKYQIKDDYELMNKWANDVDLEERKNDIIGGIKNVGLATLQHLRMDFGADTVKPDQRVMEVLINEFQVKVQAKKAILMVEEIAGILDRPVREMDSIFVNYGSGYYDNKNKKAQDEVRMEIALKLVKLGLSIDMIEEATGISRNDISKKHPK